MSDKKNVDIPVKATGATESENVNAVNASVEPQRTASSALDLAEAKDRRANGGNVISVLDNLNNKNTGGFTSSTFQKGEIIRFKPEYMRLSTYKIGSNEGLKLLVLVGNKVKALYLSAFYKTRYVMTEDGVVDFDNPVSNGTCPVSLFYQECPSQLVFLASMIGQEIRISDTDDKKFAGFDAKANNGRGGTSTDPKLAKKGQVASFEFLGSRPSIDPSYLEDYTQALDAVKNTFNIA